MLRDLLIDRVRIGLRLVHERTAATFEFPAYPGYSIGRWEGDTLVVETRGFNDRTPIDAMGQRRENMHVTEPFRRKDF
jgi:hypothetical protein